MKPIHKFFTTCGLVAMVCCGCPTKNNSNTAFGAEKAKEESVERYYFVKGMTCGGCVFGVKKALQRAGIEKSQILEVDYATPDPENKTGHAKVQYPKDQYKGTETDCKIVKEIRSNPGYMAYWDNKNPDPCGLEKKTN